VKKQHHLYDQNTAQLEAKISALETILLEKEAVISEKDSAIQKLTQDVEHLAFHNDQMRRLIFGSKRERFIPQVHPDQLTLSFEEEVAAVSGAVKEEQEKIRVEYERRKVRKKHPGRMLLPDHLPVNEIVLDPEQDTTGRVYDKIPISPKKIIKNKVLSLAEKDLWKIICTMKY
jgi:hypothetical protein